jgi:uncharacterized protein YbjT (DUF2867 family)
MENKTALVIGATGATGKELVKQLLENENYSKVKIFVRSKIDLSNAKLEQHVVDFDKISEWKNEFVGDDLFSALGTTIKIAKTKENQYRIDYTYQYEVAKFASENKVKNYVLVSAYGANSKSLIFYSRMKGELENAIKKLSFEQIHIFQPGILDRNISDNRFMEKLSLKVIRFFNKLGILKSQKPLPVKELASKMIQVVKSKSNQNLNYYKLNEIFEI